MEEGRQQVEQKVQEGQQRVEEGVKQGQQLEQNEL